jgi:hypothetical protein
VANGSSHNEVGFELDDVGFGMADYSFDTFCIVLGDGNQFTWRGDFGQGPETTHRIERLDEVYDHPPHVMNNWRLETYEGDTKKGSIILDVGKCVLLQDDGEEVFPQDTKKLIDIFVKLGRLTNPAWMEKPGGRLRPPETVDLN